MPTPTPTPTGIAAVGEVSVIGSYTRPELEVLGTRMLADIWFTEMPSLSRASYRLRSAACSNVFASSADSDTTSAVKAKGRLEVCGNKFADDESL
jgi:hypothetical protein